MIVGDAVAAGAGRGTCLGVKFLYTPVA